jgi:hypothetical protein
MFSGPYKPIAVDGEKPASHGRQRDVSPAFYLASVLGQPALQRGVKRFSRVHELPVTIETIDALKGWSHILGQRVLWTGLELLDELVRERLVEFKEKCMLVAQGGRILP